MEESGQLDAPISFTPGKKPRYPLNRGGGRFGEEANLVFRIVQPVTYSLYRVPHPDPFVCLGYPESVHNGVREYDSVARRASRFM